MGNLWDRLASGRVVDFLLFYVKQYQWPVFNLADSAIVVGASLQNIGRMSSSSRLKHRCPRPGPGDLGYSQKGN